jgi:hypothetical protein
MIVGADQMTAPIRALVTGAGSGSSGNLIRALRSMNPKPTSIGINNDKFALKVSLADRNYLCPQPDRKEFINHISEIINRERINVILPTDDVVVKVLSNARNRLPVELLLPRRKTIDLCQDKYALTVFLRERNVPAPLTYQVKSLQNLKKIFDKFPRNSLLWCRARRGARSLAATPVCNADQARAWITQWRDLRGISVSDFTIGEYLPGRHFMVQSLWLQGELLRAKAVEILSYFAAGNNPSGVFSLATLARTTKAPQAVAVALDAVRAVDRRPSGAFFSELKEDTDGIPSVTEINAGRFPAGVTALLAAGDDNMIAMYVAAAVGAPLRVSDPLADTQEYYLVRDLDNLPGVLQSDDLLRGQV